MKSHIIAGLVAVALAFGAQSVVAKTGYAVTGSIKGPDSRWDLLTIDPARHRLYMARVGGVTAIDLQTGRVEPTLVSAKLAHGVALIGDSGMVAASSADTNSLLFFAGQTGAVAGETKVGAEPDAVVYDPATRTIVAVGAHDLTIVDPATRKVLATVPLQGDPEFGVVDGKGLLYDNIRDLHEITVIDLRLRKVTGHVPLAGCGEPTGLAYDTRSGLIVAVCGSGVVKFVRASDRREVASIPVGEGADAVILDERRQVVFIPSGHSGTLSIISVADAGHPRVIQTLRTQIGTRTGAVDPATGRVYLPSADFKPAVHGPWPDVVPGTMRYLIVSPR